MSKKELSFSKTVDLVPTVLPKINFFTSSFERFREKTQSIYLAASEYRLILISLLESFIAIYDQIVELMVELLFKRKVLSRE